MILPDLYGKPLSNSVSFSEQAEIGKRKTSSFLKKPEV